MIKPSVKNIRKDKKEKDAIEAKIDQLIDLFIASIENNITRSDELIEKEKPSFSDIEELRDIGLFFSLLSNAIKLVSKRSSEASETIKSAIAARLSDNPSLALSFIDSMKKHMEERFNREEERLNREIDNEDKKPSTPSCNNYDS